MITSWKKALGVAFVLGWVSSAMCADGSGSGSASGSLPPAGPPVVQTAPPMYYDAPGPIDREGNGGDPGFQIGGTWHILRPVISNNAAFTLSAFPGAVPASTATATTTQNFRYDYTSDPSLWIGYTLDSGLGVRGTWFHMDSGAQHITATLSPIPAGGGFSLILAPPGSAGTAAFLGLGGGPVNTTNIGLGAAQTHVFDFASDIKMDIWDLDVTQNFQVGRVDVTAGGGVRFYHLAQDMNFSRRRTGTAAGTVDFANENDSASYNSAGPDLLVEGFRRFGDLGLGVYANTRAGLLFGDKHDRAYTVARNNTAAGAAGAPQTTSTFTSDQELTIGFAEIELGLAWSRNLGNVNPFVRVGFEAREYWGVGNAQAVYGASSGNVGAYGLALSAGIGF